MREETHRSITPVQQTTVTGSKVSNPAIIQVADSAPSLLPGMLLSILLLATVLALLASFGLLTLYRRAVLGSMRARSEARTDEGAPPVTSGRPAQTEPDLAVLDRDSPITSAAPAETLYSEALYGPWRTAAVYVVAGFCFALVMAAAFLESTQLEFNVMRFLFLFWIYAWPVVLTVNLVAAATRRAKLATALVYFVVFAALGAMAVAKSPALDWGQVVFLWLMLEVPPTVLLLAFLNRRIRAVGPLVLVFMILAVTGAQVALSVAGSNEGLLRSIAEIGVALGLNAFLIFIGLFILGFAVFGPLGWLTLRWLGTRYERKQISDQSITLDAIWLVFGIIESIVLISGGAWFLLSGLLAFAVYKVVARAGFRVLGRDASSIRERPRLLMLRVFSLGRRSERLFDALATHWRHVGSIQLIAGPDLATTTVEPHEFLDFLSGKLARRFIDGPETLELRLSETDPYPDEDGRFRVSDFFCYDDTWQMVLSRLADESEAVLMDLRGFSPQNAGVVYEINELVDNVPLGRVVFVVDDTTDEVFLRQTVQEAWDRMRPTSPNRSSTVGQLTLFRLTGTRGELGRLLHALSGAARVMPLTAAKSS
jgi:hypothetical protein